MIYTTQRRRFVYDTWDNGSRLDRVMVECTLSITHCLRLNLQLHAIDLVRTCRISSFCTVAWQLARFQLTRRIARSLGDSWASCYLVVWAFVQWAIVLWAYVRTPLSTVPSTRWKQAQKMWYMLIDREMNLSSKTKSLNFELQWITGGARVA